MIKFLTIFLGLCLTQFLQAGFNDTVPELTPITITVIDTEGQPVEGAKVYASLIIGGPAWGVTDADGKVRLMIHSEATLYLTVQRDGYYDTGGEVFRGGYHNDGNGGLVGSKVMSEYTVELKEIRNPVPMVEGNIFGQALPFDKGPLLYDMVAKDWVAPFGRGQTGHIIFTMTEAIDNEERESYVLQVSFPNEGDGIQPFFAGRTFSMEYGSNQAPPYQAPLDGYQPTFEFLRQRKKTDGWRKLTVKNRNFIFRTLTQKDASGRIISAYHGWLEGDVEFAPLKKTRTVRIEFTYFFNPDPDMETRSLEYDKFVEYTQRQVITEEQLKAEAERPERELR